jgi:hypothetical protein
MRSRNEYTNVAWISCVRLYGIHAEPGMNNDCERRLLVRICGARDGYGLHTPCGVLGACCGVYLESGMNNASICTVLYLKQNF